MVAALALMLVQSATAVHAQAGVDAVSQRTFVQAGQVLLDPGSGRVERHKTIVIESGKVVEVRDGFQGEGQVVDLRDRFVLPGLIDSHTHITFESGPSADMDSVKKTSVDRALDGVLYARRTLYAGFTTIADLGVDPEATLALRDAIAAGKTLGPRIIAAVVVSAHGGHGDIHGFRPDVMRLLAPPGLCSGADDCSRTVRQAVQRGADLIKIASTGGVMSNSASGVGQQMSDEELAAIVRTAHRLGRRVVCHAHGTDGINAALRAGVDAIEHGTYLDAESIRLLKANDAYLVPTLLAGETTRQLARSAAWMPPAVKQKALEVAPNMMSALKRAHESGVKIAFGTDSGVSHHGDNAREFALMVQAGLAPLDAIRSATVWGAAHNGLSAEMGSIAPGKIADLIAVDGDPLRDITELERVGFVMQAGHIVKQ